MNNEKNKHAKDVVNHMMHHDLFYSYSVIIYRYQNEPSYETFYSYSVNKYRYQNDASYDTFYSYLVNIYKY
jgi:hypothetical protein